MKTTKKNYTKEVQKLINGYVVADSHGNQWLASDINNHETFVWCGHIAKRTDWPITDLCIQQDLLGVPDESGDEHVILCRWSLNSDCNTPIDSEDLMYNGGFIQYSYL